MDAPREYGFGPARRFGGRAPSIRARLAAAFMIGGVAASTACAAPGDDSAEAPQTGSERVFTQSDDGRRVELSTGDSFELRLRASPGTGYGWAVEDPAPTELELLSEEYSADPDAPVGGEETYYLRFRAVEPGAAELRMVYRRPWEAGVEPLRTFSLDIEIED